MILQNIFESFHKKRNSEYENVEISSRKVIKLLLGTKNVADFLRYRNLH